MKVLFFDIDGTLVESRLGIKKIPEGVIRALKRIQKQGHKIFICSGRPKKMLEEMFLQSYFDGYVLFNGAYVEIEGKSIFENRMDEQLLRNLCQVLDDVGAEYMLETAKDIYINDKNTKLYEFFVTRGHPDMFTCEFDFDDVMTKTIKLECNNNEEDISIIEKAIDQNFGHVLGKDQHGTENSFEIYPSNVSKAVGILKVLEYYAVDQKDTYAFGDGLNDVEMFKTVGTSIAMGNAVSELKEIATIVCKPINENGLAEILDELFA